EIVDFAESEQFIDTPVKRYSSGMRVRLAFAVAAHLEPEILVIDEVLAVGDIAFQEKCIGKMQDIAGHGRTILFVSHNMGTIRQLCPRGIVLSRGRVIADAEIGEAVGCYLESREQNSENPFREDNPDRRTTGAARLTGFRIFSEEGLEVENLVAGEKVHFEVRFESNGQKVEDIRIRFRNSLGIAAAEIASKWMMVPPTRHAEGVMRFTFDKLPLPPSRYRVVLHCFADGRRTDFIDNAAFFTVASGSIYPSGELPRTAWSTVLVPYECSFLPREEVEVETADKAT
ncbi:MAG: ABC transporter ATP-binding protein, partial [Opitutales bacterium]